MNHINAASLIDRKLLQDMADNLYDDMFGAYDKEFRRQVVPDSRITQVCFQGVYLATLMRLAAVLAVDIGMSAHTFHAIATESHGDAYRNAPKWG